MKKRWLLTWLFWAAVFLWFVTPIELGDVWWHLRTGQWILENMRLPASDHFSIAGGGSVFVEKAFWLCQILLYGVFYRLAGLTGLVFMKAALFTGIFFLIERLANKNGFARPYSLLMLVPAIFIASFYDEIRPQTFSFFFFALTVYLLERRGKQLLVLPPLLLIWANMHGGFVMGAGFAALYAVREFFSGRQRDLRFISIVILAVLASLINPNGAQAFGWTLGFLKTSEGGGVFIHEHLPLEKFAAFTGENPLFYTLAGLGAVTAASFLIKGNFRKNFFYLLVFAGLSYTAYITFRAGFFYAIFATFCLGKNIGEIRQIRVPDEKKPLKPGRAGFVPWAVFAAVIASVVPYAVNHSLIENPMIDERLIPIKTADFVLRENPPGNIFHPYEWGGYFIWRLYPRYKVFIDGRDIGLAGEYEKVLNAGPGWQGILDRLRVNTAMYWPFLPYKKRVPPIIFALLKDKGWSPVYWDLQSIVFVRSGLAKNPIDKGAVWELLTSIAAQNAGAEPRNADRWAALGEIYANRDMPWLAREALSKALAISPDNQRFISLLNRIQTMRYSTSN
ncbi:MAG: hypothetical protein M0Z59_05585 [Nitrospiraceae bacterium]|nr:hypothetical protein [Nitrospiraceae bacterium]